MRLTDILNESVNILDVDNVKKLTKEQFERITNRAELGKGNYNTVYVNDQYSDNKVIQTMNPRFNGYLQYVNEILKLGKNRYLPQIYEISVYQDYEYAKEAGEWESEESDNSNVSPINFYVVTMERLIPSTKIDDEEILSLIERNIGHKLTTKERKQIETYSPNIESPYFEYLTRFIEGSLKVHSGREPMLPTIKKVTAAHNLFTDTEFRNALRLMKSIKLKTDTAFDIHSQNLMFRRTPYGIQMVFTDPFYD